MASLISRAGWGARKPNGRYTKLLKTRGTKVHYTGGWVDPRIVDDHRICLQLMMQFQHQHMAGNGWTDFAYNLAGCPHRRVIEGRGFGVMSAANGPGNNTGHYAILALVGSSGYTVPGDGLLHAVRDGIELLQARGAGKEIRGHRDGYATSCPGPRLYAWVRAGAPRPKTSASTSSPTTEDLVSQLPLLKQGADSFDVKTLRANIFVRGGLTEDRYGGAAGLKAWLENTVFDAALAADVKTFQASHKLAADGIVGPKTWPHLLRVA